MNTILGWVLVTISFSYGSIPVYSPPMVNLNDCIRMKTSIDTMRKAIVNSPESYSQCVQVNLVK